MRAVTLVLALALFGASPGGAQEFADAVFAGVALGMVAMKTRSILAGIVLHITVAWTMEIMALYHTGRLPRFLDGD